MSGWQQLAKGHMMFKRIYNYFYSFYTCYKRKKMLENLRKQDPFIY